METGTTCRRGDIVEPVQNQLDELRQPVSLTLSVILVSDQSKEFEEFLQIGSLLVGDLQSSVVRDAQEDN